MPDTYLRNIYVATLPPSFTSTRLKALFSRAGPVESAKVAVEPDTLRRRGYGFVLFQEPAGAKEAITIFDGQIVEGFKLQVRLAHAAAAPGFELKPSTTASVPPQVRAMINNVTESPKPELPTLRPAVQETNNTLFSFGAVEPNPTLAMQPSYAVYQPQQQQPQQHHQQQQYAPQMVNYTSPLPQVNGYPFPYQQMNNASPMYTMVQPQPAAIAPPQNTTPQYILLSPQQIVQPQQQAIQQPFYYYSA